MMWFNLLDSWESPVVSTQSLPLYLSVHGNFIKSADSIQFQAFLYLFRMGGVGGGVWRVRHDCIFWMNKTEPGLFIK